MKKTYLQALCRPDDTYHRLGLFQCLDLVIHPRCTSRACRSVNQCQWRWFKLMLTRMLFKLFVVDTLPLAAELKLRPQVGVWDWGMKLGQIEIDLMRSISKARLGCLNFDLNFIKFPNSEIGTLKLRLLFTGVEVELKVELEVELEIFETP